ncbi:AbrB/MazE/SpoVT family DNA-binding domain-containing protein [Candidatus Saccharibacteria bacterium]|nr:AbrB/MazE/SpoVT family DNA-binding domain-containing protein [Candidatus Saccharibacteria bacterium]
MKASLIKIGNSRGVRIPKVLIEEAGLGTELELKLKNGKIFIEPAKKRPASKAKKMAMIKAYGPGYSALAKDWDTPEEDAAWAYLQ